MTPFRIGAIASARNVTPPMSWEHSDMPALDIRPITVLDTFALHECACPHMRVQQGLDRRASN